MQIAKSMKTLLSFFISSLFVVPVFAQYGQSRYGQTVTISFNDNGNSRYGNDNNYQVVIDGRSYSSNMSNNNGRWNSNTSSAYNNPITLQLQTGQHSLQVYNVRNSRYGNTATPVYSSSFIIRPGYDANINIRNNGRVQLAEVPQAYNNGNYNNGRHNRRGRDWDDDHDRNGGYNNGGYNNWDRNDRYRAPMADYEFSQFLQSVRNKWFQSNKVTAERNAFSTSGNYFSTYQVRQLLQLISSESNRLELAELSYRVISDPGNFSQLYDLFSQRCRNELERYIRSSRY